MIKNINNKAMELQSDLTRLIGRCEIISIDVNVAMDVWVKHGREEDSKFLARRYVELAEELAKYGIIDKEWES